MPKLQKANLGVPPSGSGGDDQRTANLRFNENADILNACVALGYSFLTDNTTIRPDQVGARYGVSMGVAGKGLTLPLVSSVSVNACVHVFNVGPPITIATQGKDGTQIRSLNTGDWATYSADGESFWNVVARGRMFPDEVVSGFLTVANGLTVGGDVVVKGGVAASGKLIGVNGANLLLNGSGELGNVPGGWGGGWLTAANWATTGDYFANSAPINSVSYAGCNPIAMPPGVTLTLSGEIYAGGVTAGSVWFRLVFLSASKSAIGVSPNIAATNGADWTFRSNSMNTPAGTAYVYVQLGIEGTSPAVAAGGVAWRRLKLEYGATPSLYSQEASIAYLSGAPAFSGRPTFAGKVPYDTGNFDPSKYAPLSGAVFANTVSIRSGAGQFRGTATAISGTSTGSVNDGIQFSSVHGPFDREAFFAVREYYNQSTNGLIAVRAGTEWRTFLFRMDGNAYCEGNWSNGSDERVKTNIAPIDDALSKMRVIRGCTWDRLDGVAGGIGFIAQDVQKVFPQHVHVASPTRTLTDGTTIKDFLSLDTGGIAAALHHQAILELMDELESMRTRIRVLESKVSA